MSVEQADELAPSIAASTPPPARALEGEENSAAKAASSTPRRSERGLSLAAHPRAARRVDECKAWGGLAGFVIGGYLSLSSNTLLDTAFRALLTGIVCYVAVWAAAVFLWRRLIVAELRQREYELSSELARRTSQSSATGDRDSDAATAAP